MKQLILLAAIVAMACAAVLIDTNAHDNDDDKHDDAEHQLAAINGLSHGADGALVDQKVATGVEEGLQHIHQLHESVGDDVQEREGHNHNKGSHHGSKKGSQHGSKKKRSGKKGREEEAEEEGGPHGKKSKRHPKHKGHVEGDEPPPDTERPPTGEEPEEEDK